LADGTILRTHVLRPTWHFVTPADIRWLLELTAPRINAMNAYYYRQLELDEAVFARSNAVIARALESGNQLTKAEIEAVLQQAGILGSSLRIGHIIVRAELDAIICSGGRRGKQFTYSLLDERAPNARRLGRDEALAELTRRYFSSRSPASAQDFSWWSGLTLTDARAGIDMVKSGLTPELIDGVEYYFSDSTPPPAADPVIHLLPAYDEYIVAYADRGAVYEDQPAENLDSRANVLFNYTILLNGMVAGTWKRAIKKQKVFIIPTFFTNLTSAEHEAFAAAAECYGQFLGLAVELPTRS
jgi:hypothetical protein